MQLYVFMKMMRNIEIENSPETCQLVNISGSCVQSQSSYAVNQRMTIQMHGQLVNAMSIQNFRFSIGWHSYIMCEYT